MRDLLLQDRVGRLANGVGVAFGFQDLVDLGLGEGGISAELAAQLPVPISSDHRLENQPPILSAVDVAGTQEATLQFADPPCLRRALQDGEATGFFGGLQGEGGT